MNRAVWVLLCAAAVLPASTPDYLAVGHDHFFNLEYDEAVVAFEQQRAITPKDPHVLSFVATALLYKELHRLGRLQSGAFTGDNAFLDWEKPDPDSEGLRLFERYLHEGRRIAEATLKVSPHDRMALYVLAQNYGLEATYQFALKKAYFDALSSGRKARKFADLLVEQHPGFVDGYLVAGVQEYTIGSLPWIVKPLLVLGGVRGNKDKGIEFIERVASDGALSRTQAQVILTVILRREKRPLEAAEYLEKLITDFPRNYLFRLELGAMYEDADQLDRAAGIFRSLLARVRRGEPGYGRMPPHYREALENKIEQLNARLR